MPSWLKAGFSPARASAVVPGRMQPSLSITPVLVLIGTISASSLPAAWASEARLWLCTAKASCVEREMSYLAATFSAVSPMPI